MIDFQAYYFPRIHHIVTESQGYFFQINDFSSILYFSHKVIELDYGKIYRKTLYLMVKTMVSCRFSLQSSHKVAFQLLPGYDVSRRVTRTAAGGPSWRRGRGANVWVF